MKMLVFWVTLAVPAEPAPNVARDSTAINAVWSANVYHSLAVLWREFSVEFGGCLYGEGDPLHVRYGLLYDSPPSRFTPVGVGGECPPTPLKPIGRFHSHTSGACEFSRRDVETFEGELQAYGFELDVLMCGPDRVIIRRMNVAVSCTWDVERYRLVLACEELPAVPVEPAQE